MFARDDVDGLTCEEGRDDSGARFIRERFAAHSQ